MRTLPITKGLLFGKASGIMNKKPKMSKNHYIFSEKEEWKVL